MAGTYAYMAPESLKCQLQGFETDIWALGILLFEFFHAYEPFKGNDPKTILKKIEILPIPFVERLINKPAQNLVSSILQYEKFKRLNLLEIAQHEFMKIEPDEIIQFTLDTRKFFSMREITNKIPQKEQNYIQREELQDHKNEVIVRRQEKLLVDRRN